MSTANFRPCAVVPTFNHVRVLGHIIGRLRAEGLAVIVVDDGSGPAEAARIAEICSGHADVSLCRHARNHGKGAAIATGLTHAVAQGYSHALQVDADGQHDLAQITTLLMLGSAHPNALICGVPAYDSSVPRARKIGRWVTHIWVAINTLSPKIIDSMCGFRLYPLAATCAILQQGRFAKAMGFDTEILVRLKWAGTPVITTPVAVTYPAGNHSNFRLWRDNADISLMHARLFFGMLRHLPQRLRAR
jgi:glycosyltransferase involved in cell wall biosynthesis